MDKTVINRSFCVKNLKSGFTLVEILIAMIILTLLASGLFSVMVSSRYLVERSKNRAKAIEVAKSEVERMKQYIRWDLWSLGTGTDPLNPTSTWSAWDGGTYPPYSVRYKVDPGAGGADYRKMTVEVRWNATTL